MRPAWKALVALASVLALSAAAHAQGPAGRADNVLIVTFDGFRWQEFFGGY